MFKLSALPYPKDALAPYISENTLNYHYDKHHAGYVNKLNAGLQGHPDLLEQTLEQLLQNYQDTPEELHVAILHNGGQHYNHTLYWESMSPDGGGEPEGGLAEAIATTFGSFIEFKEKFKAAGKTQFGSGWVWLSLDSANNLVLESTSNAHTPLVAGKKPILTMDVWEHAYYLDYQNARPDYIDEFFNIINWTEAGRKYNEALTA